MFTTRYLLLADTYLQVTIRFLPSDCLLQDYQQTFEIAGAHQRGSPLISSKQRHKAAKERRRRQKERAASQSSSAQTFACPECISVCAPQEADSTATNGHAGWFLPLQIFSQATFPIPSTKQPSPNLVCKESAIQPTITRLLGGGGPSCFHLMWLCMRKPGISRNLQFWIMPI